MPSSLRHRFTRILERVREWFRPSAPAQPPNGRLVHGSHRESAGILTLAPMIAPHRPYWIYLPPGHTVAEQLPLVVMLHGCRQDANSFGAGTRMNALADRERFLVLYPEQRRLANPHQCWNWFDPSSQHGDGEAAIIAGMVRVITADYNADRSRVYVAGLSSGGALANTLASCYAGLFAACAVHSGMMFQAARSIADAERAMQHGSEFDPAKSGEEAFRLSGHMAGTMPAIVIHGARDDRVREMNADQIVTQFVRMNQLAEKETGDSPTVETRIASSRGGYRYEIRDYLFDDQPLLRRVAIDDLAHAWSGGDAQYPYNDPKGPDATALIWDFFALHQRLPIHRS